MGPETYLEILEAYWGGRGMLQFTMGQGQQYKKHQGIFYFFIVLINFFKIILFFTLSLSLFFFFLLALFLFSYLDASFSPPKKTNIFLKKQAERKFTVESQ